MATMVAFSKYVTTEGKAERLDEYRNEVVTITETGGVSWTGVLSAVFDDPEEGWLVTLSTRDERGYGWAYVSDIESFTVGSL